MRRVQTKRRFASHGRKGKPMTLREEHPAVVEGRALFPTQVREPDHDSILFKPGANNSKIGSHVAKGKLWAGFPIYTLSLEERATCPRVCEHWRDCLVPGTKVLTADLRWINIENLQLGQNIAAFTEQPNKYGRRTTKIAVVEKLGRAKEQCFRVTTDRGAVTASAGHLWLHRRTRWEYKWRETARIRKGDKLSFFHEPWETDFSYDAGRLRGFVEGEGTCGATQRGSNFAKSRIGWSQRPTKLCDEIIEAAHRLDFKTGRYERVAGVKNTDISHIDIKGGWKEVAHFLGRIRPTRLVEKAAEIWEGHATTGRGSAYATVLSVEPVGEREVITIQTSTKTMVAAGFFTHNCYGNHMPFARRWAAGDALEQLIPLHLQALAKKHPGGFVARLHVLGDFYSTRYVELWHQMLLEIPQLHVYGYTRRELSDPVGAILGRMQAKWPTRWRIRWSERPGEMGTHTTADVDARGMTDKGIVCPAQTEGDAVCCGNCSLCWSTSTPIVFINH